MLSAGLRQNQIRIETESWRLQTVQVLSQAGRALTDGLAKLEDRPQFEVRQSEADAEVMIAVARNAMPENRGLHAERLLAQASKRLSEIRLMPSDRGEITPQADAEVLAGRCAVAAASVHAGLGRDYAGRLADRWARVEATGKLPPNREIRTILDALEPADMTGAVDTESRIEDATAATVLIRFAVEAAQKTLEAEIDDALAHELG